MRIEMSTSMQPPPETLAIAIGLPLNNSLKSFSEDKEIKYKDDKSPTPDEKNYTITFRGKDYFYSSVYLKEFY